MTINYSELEQHWYRRQKAKLIKAGFSVIWIADAWLYGCVSPSGQVLFTDDDEDYLWTFLIRHLRNTGDLK
jgi:hypothetical protein